MANICKYSIFCSSSSCLDDAVFAFLFHLSTLSLYSEPFQYRKDWWHTLAVSSRVKIFLDTLCGLCIKLSSGRTLPCLAAWPDYEQSHLKLKLKSVTLNQIYAKGKWSHWPFSCNLPMKCSYEVSLQSVPMKWAVPEVTLGVWVAVGSFQVDHWGLFMVKLCNSVMLCNAYCYHWM